MLLDPLTPPHDTSTSISNTDNGVTVAMDSTADSTPADAFVATPMSLNISMDGRDDRLYVDERANFHDSTDEDQDMSEGGAMLTMTLSHTQQLNAEMGLLDAELMGPDNLTDLLQDAQFQAVGNDNSFLYNDSFPSPEHSYQDIQDPMDDVMEPVALHPALNTSNLPTSLSAVSLQLQHLQDGQELEVGAEDHANHNSTSPLPLPFISPPTELDVSSGNVGQVHYVSLAEVSPAHNIPLVLGSQNAPHLWSTEGSITASILGVVVIPQIQNTQPPNPQNIYPSPLVDDVGDDGSGADQDEVEDHINLSLGDFLYSWGESGAEQDLKRQRVPDLAALLQQRTARNLEPARRDDLRGELCDIQRINWAALGVTRLEARQMRRHTYKNYTNSRYAHDWHPRLRGVKLGDYENYFKFRRMDFDHEVNLGHFQLRNLLTCASRGHVFYAGVGKVQQWNPSTSTNSMCQTSVAMDLTNPAIQPWHSDGGGVHITSLATAHDILVAGGYFGEYALVNLRANKTTTHTEGLIADERNSITNHIQIHTLRTSSSPVVTFSSNDRGIRILDVNTNKFIAEHRYDDFAINCSAVSPDQRLRVLVGDTYDVMICNSETGEILQTLDGHRDFGFACDWADDGWTVATGNQDMQVKIWDARKWTSSSGVANPVTTIAAEMAGVRKLKFSPLGSGKRVLVAAEPADFINVIDAQTFNSKQTLSFFGEIGGVDFTNDGQDLIVANCDNMRGGIIQYERCGLSGQGLHELETSRSGRRRSSRSRSYDWISDEEDVVNHPKSRGTVTHRQRKADQLGVNIGHF
ncbi:hypothetical protein G7Y89_g14828 [Cudoniella acicularis]|uniref:WD repeat-containing protein n=1 Tax=Cudoniella acicularis TaxID=354080 RepID=A0A8H4VT40_9HELO|nr:hypothetical protein G7Y89_g14828 [Cudoniella acicularis]